MRTIEILLLVMFFINGTNVFALDMECGNLTVDNTKINGSGQVYFTNEDTLIPLRSVFENIGACVEWNENERQINIYYDNKQYVALLEDYDYNNEYKEIRICKNIYKNCTLDGLFIQMSLFGSGGYYRMINDMTYLDDDNMIRLLYYFGYYIDINKEKKIANIFPITEKDYQYDDYPNVISADVDIEAETLLGSIFHVESVDIVDYDVRSTNSDRFCVNIKFRSDDEDKIFKWNEWCSATKTEENIVLNKVNHVVDNNARVYINSENMETEDDLYLIQCDDFYIAYGEVPVMNFK